MTGRLNARRNARLQYGKGNQGRQCMPRKQGRQGTRKVDERTGQHRQTVKAYRRVSGWEGKQAGQSGGRGRLGRRDIRGGRTGRLRGHDWWDGRWSERHSARRKCGRAGRLERQCKREGREGRMVV